MKRAKNYLGETPRQHEGLPLQRHRHRVLIVAIAGHGNVLGHVDVRLLQISTRSLVNPPTTSRPPLRFSPRSNSCDAYLILAAHRAVLDDDQRVHLKENTGLPVAAVQSIQG